MTVLRLGHINLRGPAGLIEQLKSFYVDVIGLREGPRPTFRSGSSGHWLYAGDHDVIHLSVDSRRTAVADAPHAGFNHFALLCNRANFDGTRAGSTRSAWNTPSMKPRKRDRCRCSSSIPPEHRSN